MNSPHVPINSFYSYDINRLEDILLPSDAFINMVNYIENVDLSIEIKKVDKESGKKYDVCLAPYLYTEAASFHMKPPGDSIEEHLQYKRAQQAIIMSRIEPIKNNSITAEAMRKFDADPNMRAIVHLSTGRIIPFSNDCVKDLTVVNMKESLPLLVDSLKKLADDPELRFDNDFLTEFKLDISDKDYRTIYCFDYEKPDPLNPSGVGLLAQTSSIVSVEIEPSLSSAAYVLDRFKKGNKIICII